jgi:two-component system, NarL family, response regulator DegU
MKNSLSDTLDRITILIADGHSLLRRRLKTILAEQQDIQVVGEGMEGPLLSRVEACEPHILLLDLRLPRLNVLKMLARIHAKSLQTKVLLLAEYFTEDFVTKALQDGVHGFVPITTSATDLVKAIRAVCAGEFWVQRRLLTGVVKNLRQRVDKLEGFPTELRAVLSDRESEVVIWAMQGMTNKQIAARLGISPKTVKTHLRNIFRKVSVSRRAQLSALSLGLTPAPSRAAPQPPPVD